MINKITLLLLMLLTSTNVFSQKIPNIEKEKRPYFLVDGELKKFEKVKATLDVKIKAMGYGGSESFLTAFDKKSPVRHNLGEMPKIIIKITGDEDPEDYISIIRQTKKRKRDRRRFKQSSRSLGGKSRDVSNSEVSFELRKIGKNIYEIEFDEELLPDEYAIITSKSMSTSLLSTSHSVQTIYCFGID